MPVCLGSMGEGFGFRLELEAWNDFVQVHAIAPPLGVRWYRCDGPEIAESSLLRLLCISCVLSFRLKRGTICSGVVILGCRV